MSDGVVIGIVLSLILAAVSYYLYSRISQLERKVGLMENILLDLKVTTEQTLMDITETEEEDEEEESEEVEETRNIVVESATPRVAQQSKPVSVVRNEKPSLSVNYESMTYKELVQLSKQKGITGIRNLTKAQIIDMIRRHDSGDNDAEVVPEPLTESVDLMAAQPNTEGSALDNSEVDVSLLQ